MNILINYQGVNGAGPAISLEWARGFTQVGCNVYAAISKDICNAVQWTELLSEDNIYWIDTYKNQDHFDFLVSTVKFVTCGQRKLHNKFKNVKFDFTLRTMYSHWAYMVDCCVKKDRIVTLCHDPINHSGEKKYIKKLYYKHIKQSDEVFVLTESFKETVHKNYLIPMENIHYVPHGRMNMYSNVKDEKYHIQFNENMTNFVFFGRIEEYKGLHVLAKACKILIKKRNDFSLLIAGSGDFSPYIEEFESINNVTVINKYIPDEQVGCLFDGPNIITVIPYIDATQSGVIPIAYEYDSPIIASNTGGLYEQLNNGRIGMFFDCGDAEALADVMEKSMSDSEEIRRQIQLMREYRETLNWDRVAQLLVDELNK